MTESAEADPSLPQYALVAYIAGDLGSYLNELRPQLVPGCHLQSHITLLPPRLLKAPTPRLSAALEARLSQAEPFEVRLGDVELFQRTEVVYLPVIRGRERLIELHGALNRGDLGFPEPFEYHPHITLAQEIPAGEVEDAFRRARESWDAWKGPRTFCVERLIFVRNGGPECWQTISEHDLRRESLRKTG